MNCDVKPLPMYQVAVVSGTRAEYGLLRPVLKKLNEREGMALRLVVTGAHLSTAYGYTLHDVETDGFSVDARVDIMSLDVPSGRIGTALRTAAALEGFVRCFAGMRPAPHAVMLLGDRYEIFAAGQAAALLNIPLVHISGGDVTRGADDDWFRHCLTKLAKLHFTSCEEYRQRVIRMGEEPRRVFNVGGLGDENIRTQAIMPRGELARQLNLPLAGPYILVTMHPETQSDMPPAQQVREVLCALGEVRNVFMLFTGANADAGGGEINAEVKAFCTRRINAAFMPSLGSARYLAAMRSASAVVGNSSSGVAETPSLGVPAVDIGGRQTGRVTGENVLHCPLERAEIAAALATALSPGFAVRAKRAVSPYNGGDTSGRIVSILEDFLRSGERRRPKLFYDGEE